MRPEDPHVFLSFSPAEDEFGHRLARDLTAGGVLVWTDEFGRGRLTLDETLANQAAAVAARVYLVVLSPSAVASEHVMGVRDRGHRAQPVRPPRPVSRLRDAHTAAKPTTG
jgi:hypothetical protein